MHLQTRNIHKAASQYPLPLSIVYSVYYPDYPPPMYYVLNFYLPFLCIFAYKNTRTEEPYFTFTSTLDIIRGHHSRCLIYLEVYVEESKK
jgi:hypothetical protein